MHHYFNTEIAKEVGVNAAIILENIAHWVLRNKANNKNFYDGHYWTFNSNAAMAELFPYMNARQVRTALDSLRKKGMVLTGNYNKSSYDRTLWYTVSDDCAEQFFPEIIHLTNKSNGDDGKVQPIPDINTSNKPYINFSTSPCDAPIPAESVRKEKPKSLWDISREITGNDPFTFPYQPTSGSEKNSAAGIVNQGHLVKNLTDKEKDAFLEKRGALLGNVYSMAFKREIPLRLQGGLTTLTMEEAFNYWLDHALYRESAREAYLSKFLQAWENILKYRHDRFWMPVSGGDGYVWQNVIRKYAREWNPGTPDERREAKAKEILDENSTLD